MEKIDKVHFYLVFWEARSVEDDSVEKGCSEIHMDRGWSPGDASVVTDYLNVINEGTFYKTMPTSVLYLGEFDRPES